MYNTPKSDFEDFIQVIDDDGTRRRHLERERARFLSRPDATARTRKTIGYWSRSLVMNESSNQVCSMAHNEKEVQKTFMPVYVNFYVGHSRPLRVLCVLRIKIQGAPTSTQVSNIFV